MVVSLLSYSLALGNLIAPAPAGHTVTKSAGVRLTARMYKQEVIQGEPVIVCLAFANTSPGALLLPDPAYQRAPKVEGVGESEDPPKGAGPLPTGWWFVVPPGETVTYYQNLSAFWNLEQVGRYRATGSYWARGHPAPEQRAVACWTGDLGYGPLEFEVVEPPPEEKPAYETMAGGWGDVWRDTGPPDVVSLPDLARQIGEANPDSIYLPYVWWRYFRWHVPGDPPHPVSHPLDDAQLAEAVRSFRDKYPDFPMRQWADWIEVGLTATREPGVRGKLRPALLRLAEETDDVAVRIQALSYAAVAEKAGF